MVLPSAEMPPFCVDGTSVASSPFGAPFSSVNNSPRKTSLAPLVTLPPSLVISVFIIATCCHSPIFAPQVAKVLAPQEWLAVAEVAAALDLAGTPS